MADEKDERPALLRLNTHLFHELCPPPDFRLHHRIDCLRRHRRLDGHATRLRALYDVGLGERPRHFAMDALHVVSRGVFASSKIANHAVTCASG